jgi:hypothetical protein
MNIKRLTCPLFLILLLASFSLTTQAQSIGRIQGYVEKGNLVVQVTSTLSYKVQGSYPLSTVTVYLKGTTTLATIYTDDTGTTAKSNPFTADSDGFYFFYASPARYDVKFSGTGITTPFTLSDVQVFDTDSNIYSPKSYGAKCDSTNNDTAAFSAFITAAGSDNLTLQLPPKGSCRVNTLTIPSNITLDYSAGGSFYINTGETLTIQGPQLPAPSPLSAQGQRYYNATTLTSLGILRFTGNRFVAGMMLEWFGGKGDKSTDNQAAFQAIIDISTASGKDSIILVGNGVYNMVGALQDTSLSKAQVVLPKITNTASQRVVHIEGIAIPADPWNYDAGSIIRSTLTGGDGTGAVFGVKTGTGVGCGNASCVASLISSNIKFVAKNVTFRGPVNPSNTILDLSRIRNINLYHIRVDTDDFGQGGLNPNLFPGTPIPDPICTEPTVTGQWGIKMITDNLPNKVVIDDVFVAGQYGMIRTGELGRGRNIVFHCGKIGLGIEGSTWPSHFEDVIIAVVRTPIKALGTSAEFIGYAGANAKATTYIDYLGVENDTTLGWSGVQYLIDDPNLLLNGKIDRIFYGAGQDMPLNPPVLKLETTRSERGNGHTDPTSNITGSNLYGPGSEAAVFELYKRAETTNDNVHLPWLALTTKQTNGAGKGVGVFTFTNDAIANGLDHRLAMQYVTTAGTIDSGLYSFWTMGNGALTQRAFFDNLGNFINWQFHMSIKENQTIVGGTIAPSRQFLTLGIGNLTTITPPPTNALVNSGNFIVQIHIRPTAAFTFDNTGNIFVPVGSGTAVIGKMLTFTWDYETGKWYPSY